MHPIVIADQATFDAFQNGKSVTVNSLMTEDYLKQIKRDKMHVEVWYQTNMADKPHYNGKVLSINDPVPTIPDGDPEAISLTIQKI